MNLTDIRKNIIENCQVGDNLTGHGSHLLKIVDRIENILNNFEWLDVKGWLDVKDYIRELSDQNLETFGLEDLV